MYVEKVMQTNVMVGKICFNWLLQNIYAWNYDESLGSNLPKPQTQPKQLIRIADVAQFFVCKWPQLALKLKNRISMSPALLAAIDPILK